MIALNLVTVLLLSSSFANAWWWDRTPKLDGRYRVQSYNGFYRNYESDGSSSDVEISYLCGQVLNVQTSKRYAESSGPTIYLSDEHDSPKGFGLLFFFGGDGIVITRAQQIEYQIDEEPVADYAEFLKKKTNANRVLSAEIFEKGSNFAAWSKEVFTETNYAFETSSIRLSLSKDKKTLTVSAYRKSRSGSPPGELWREGRFECHYRRVQ